jgi:hypothetical protein
MLIAFLALLGVDLIVIVVLLGVVLSRKRWVNRQPGAFLGAIRLVDGELEGFAPKWPPRIRPLGPGRLRLDQGAVPVPKTSCCPPTGLRSNGPPHPAGSSVLAMTPPSYS